MMKKLLFFLIAIVFSINVFAQSTQLTNAEKAKLYPTTVSRYQNDWTQKHYRQCIKLFMNDPLQFGDIVFIGNSITEKGRDWSKKFDIDHIRNRGIAGDVTDGVLMRLNEIVYFKPKAVFIMVGVNDLFNIHHKEAGDRFKYDKIVPSTKYVGNNILKIAKFIHRKSPTTKIFVRTILPTSRKYLKQDILAVNRIIKKNEAKGYYKVIDLYSQFVNENGDMTKDLAVDGVHPSEKGYAKWVKFEKPIIEGLLNQK